MPTYNLDEKIAQRGEQANYELVFMGRTIPLKPLTARVAAKLLANDVEGLFDSLLVNPAEDLEVMMEIDMADLEDLIPEIYGRAVAGKSRG